MYYIRMAVQVYSDEVASSSIVHLAASYGTGPKLLSAD